jgi:hypothetical protein
MLSLNSTALWGQLPHNIRIRLVDETGKSVDPLQIRAVDYLSRFMNICVVNKVFAQMMADKRSGVIEVYQDRIVVREN